MPKTTRYGVSKVEVDQFVRENEVVAAWAGRYADTYENAHRLCRFFKWLRMVKGVEITPKEFLNELIRQRASGDVEERQRSLRLVLEHTKYNPDFADIGDQRKYYVFLSIKNWCAFNEVPLTTAKSVYGKINKWTNRRHQITLAQAKKILSLLRQRERTILLIMLQSGMEIGAVLSKFNFMWDAIKPQLDENKPRVKVEFSSRKFNNFPYFTYISRDAVQELRKWLMMRARTMSKLGLETCPIFITRAGDAYTENNFYVTIDYYRKHGKPELRKLLKGFVTHQLRKLFKTEASIPERGIDRNVVEFWMGHVNALDSMGGVYDKTPEIHEDVIEKEYAKLEPYINIYSGVALRERGLVIDEKEQKRDAILNEFWNFLRDPANRQGLRQLIKQTKRSAE
jgi:integrase